MRDYEHELKSRIAFISNTVKSTGADGIVFGNSGGKDCALVGILCKMACENTLSLIMPCGSTRNYGEDKDDAESVAIKFSIETRLIDLTGVKNELVDTISKAASLSPTSITNISPRLRMTALYAVAASENRLVVGTGNRSERYMGYFTKWGDGAFDFNPIADLTVTEVYEFLRYLGAPDNVISKKPSAGLYEGQTDENEMGVTYKAIDRFILDGTAEKEDLAVIEKYHNASKHKLKLPLVYEANQY